MPRLDRTGPLGYGPRTGRMGRGYYSYGGGFGQLLPERPGALLPPRLPTAPTTTRTTTGTTTIDAATLRRIQAEMAQRVSTGIVATPITAMKLLTPLKTATTPMTLPGSGKLSQEQADAFKTGVGSKVVGGGGGGGGGGGNGAAPADQFAEACAAAGGSVVGSQLCKLADGAIVTVDAQGNAVCTNAVGACVGAGAGAGVAGKGGGNALLIGAAAIAALMLLR